MATDSPRFALRHVGSPSLSRAGVFFAAAIIACAALVWPIARAGAQQPGTYACCDSTGACFLGPRCPFPAFTGGYVCSPNPCPQLGRCCDASQACTLVIVNFCQGASFTVGGVCSPNPCTNTGRCCDVLAGACMFVLQIDCAIASHTWVFGGACSPNPCEQPGACCTGTACRQIAHSRCDAASPWFADACSPNPCPVRFAARWVGDANSAKAVATFSLAQPSALLNPGDNGGGLGTVLTNLKLRVYDSPTGNGVWTQPYFSHMVFSWHTAVNPAIEWVGQPQAGGTWGDCNNSFILSSGTPGAPVGNTCSSMFANNGYGPLLRLSSFAPLPTALVACCAENGACVLTTDPECLVAWNTPLGPGSTCASNPCTTSGRCCNVLTGGCAIASLAACGAATHTWTYSGVCSSNPCPPLGACCTSSSGTCGQIVQDRCAGAWTLGASCSPNPCPVAFTARWSNTSTGARAVAVFDLAQPPTLANPGNNRSGYGTLLKNLRIRVAGAQAGNGVWTQSDFSSMEFHWSVAVNPLAEWVGQPQDSGQWGIDTTTDFNLFRSTSDAPNGVYPNQLKPSDGETLTLTSFAPAAAAGPCCFADGSCGLFSEPECYTRLGAARAAGSVCASTLCPQPGVCCNSSVACTFTLAADCSSGSLWSLGGSCAPNPCVPIGPCCSVITGGCVITSEPACGLSAHTWAATGSCAPNACAQAGACCNTSLTCIRRTQARCAGSTLTWTAGTCAPKPCTLNGRCCNVTTGACAITLQSACGAASHTWLFGGACSPNPCDQPGACCTAVTGACHRLTQARCTGTSDWSSGTCSPNPCFVHFAAHWASPTTSARAIATFDLSQPPTLLNPGDNAHGYGTTFKNLHVRVYGASAGNGTWSQESFSSINFMTTVAVNTRTEWVGQPQDGGTLWGVYPGDHVETDHDFNLLQGPSLLRGAASPYASVGVLAAARDNGTSLPPNGTWYYELSADQTGEKMHLTSFAPVSPAAVACCAETGACTLSLEPDCLVSGNTALGPRTVCTTSPCTSAGRCCNVVTGGCAITALSACGAAAHTWSFGGACSPNPCDQPGACCSLSLTCRRLTQSRCTAPNFWVSGVACSPSPCVINLAVAPANSPTARTPTSAPCTADFNASGTVDSADLFAYLSAWLAGDDRAEVDGADGLTVQDVFEFLNAWMEGCEASGSVGAQIADGS